MYFLLLILFLVLIVGPVIIRKFYVVEVDIPMNLAQPTNQNNNDTFASITGSALVDFGNGVDTGATAAAGGGGGGGGTTNAAATTTGGNAPFTFGGGRFVRW